MAKKKVKVFSTLNRKKRVFSVFSKRKSYMNILYALLLLPLGIVSFVITLTLLVLSLGFIAGTIAPIFWIVRIGSVEIISTPMRILASLLSLIIGVSLLTTSLYIINRLAYSFRKFFSSVR